MNQFQPGDRVQALDWLKIHFSPGTVDKPLWDTIDVFRPYDVASIVAGPVEQEGLTWWQVRINGRTGWSAETSLSGEQLLARYDDSGWGKSISFVLSWEGGYTSDDPGGPTKYGISKNAHPDLDIKTLTRDQAIEIYKRDYWYGSDADRLPWPLCLAHFDFAVNAGVAQACVTLSRSEYNFERYIELRREFYQGLDNFHLYGGGWLRRVDDLVRVAQA